MRILVSCLALSTAMPIAAVAQTTTPAPKSPAAAVSATTLDGDTPIETVMANASGKAALEKVFPDIPTHPAYDQFKAMSLRQLAPLAGGAITDEKIAAFEAGIKAK